MLRFLGMPAIVTKSQAGAPSWFLTPACAFGAARLRTRHGHVVGRIVMLCSCLRMGSRDRPCVVIYMKFNRSAGNPD
eukprot:5911151-Pyramimonas_sp.AAC.1